MSRATCHVLAEALRWRRHAGAAIHGVAGQPRPRLLFNTPGDYAGLILEYSSLLRYIEVDQAATNNSSALRAIGARVDQVIAKAASGVTAVIYSGTVRDSVVVNSGTNGVALGTDAWSYNTNANAYHNVTAVATGSGGVAINAVAGSDMGPGTVTIDATNVIARGGPGGAGLKAWTDSSGAQATITATNSNYAAPSLSGVGAAIISAGVNQAAAPSFVNAAAGDYRQAAGSPTIDAGINQPVNGAYDFEGDPRQIGTTDIGADEFVVAPTATTGPAGAVTETSATLSGAVNALGVPTTYWFEYGPTTAYGDTTPPTAAGAGLATIAAAAAVGALSPATTYHYRAVANNAGGVTKGADQTFTTASTATTSTATSSASTTTAPTPGFAGVRLVSTRLSFARGFITLTLRCPAGTVGRCLGKTRLTARRRATSSRTATTVTLGRAAFSIAAGKQGKTKVRVSRAGRRLLGGAHRLRGKDSNAARDRAGRSKTTVAAVTIRRRHH